VAAIRPRTGLPTGPMGPPLPAAWATGTRLVLVKDKQVVGWNVALLDGSYG